MSLLEFLSTRSVYLIVTQIFFFLYLFIFVFSSRDVCCNPYLVFLCFSYVILSLPFYPLLYYTTQHLSYGWFFVWDVSKGVDHEIIILNAMIGERQLSVDDSCSILPVVSMRVCVARRFFGRARDKHTA